MNKDEILDLSYPAGYARLYQTLLRDGDIKPRRLKELMYQWYCANIEAYNTWCGETIKPIDEPDFGGRLYDTRVKPYKTTVQLCKALSLLMWNVADKEPFVAAYQALCGIYRDCAEGFRMQYGYAVNDPITTYSLCEDTLNPVHEPDAEFNFVSLLRFDESKPHFVYICAPLRGDVQKNIEFTRQKAKEVFDDGDIPICPHLMFPPIADPNNLEQDQRALKMCLKLIERCHHVNVYGSVRSDGMQQEIRHAGRLKIPVHVEQREPVKPRPWQKPGPCR